VTSSDKRELSDIVQGRDQYWNLDKRYEALQEYVATCDDEETLVTLLDWVDRRRDSKPKLEEKANSLYDSVRQKLRDASPDGDVGCGDGDGRFNYLIEELEGKGNNFFYRDRLKRIKDGLSATPLDGISSDEIVDLQLLETKLENSSYLKAKIGKDRQLAADFVSTLWVLRDKIKEARSAYARDRLKDVKSKLYDVDTECLSAEKILNLQNLKVNLENNDYIKSSMGTDRQLAADFVSTLWVLRDKIDSARSAYVERKKEESRQKEKMLQEEARLEHARQEQRKAVSRKPFFSRIATAAKVACVAAVASMFFSPGDSGKDVHINSHDAPYSQEQVIELSDADIEYDVDVSDLDAIDFDSVLSGSKDSRPVVKEIKNPVLGEARGVRVPILTYHGISYIDDGSSITITPGKFRQHLETLYRAGFTLVSLDDYVSSDFSSVPGGRKPIVITFDDAAVGQFSYSKKSDAEGNRKIDPNSAVGILNQFHLSHPDFGKSAAFFVDFYGAPFAQQDFVKEKLNALLDMGFEIGSHTYDHKDMVTVSVSEREKDIEKFNEKIDTLLGDRSEEVKYFAYPYGSYPKNINKDPLMSDSGPGARFVAAFGPLRDVNLTPSTGDREELLRLSRVIVRNDTPFEKYISAKDIYVKPASLLAMDSTVIDGQSKAAALANPADPLQDIGGDYYDGSSIDGDLVYAENTVRQMPGGLVLQDMRIKTDEKVIALTFDGCDAKRDGYDSDLIEYLKAENIPATIFLSGEWIDKNRVEAEYLAKEELFSIQNHGELHRPLSFSGNSAYGIDGTLSPIDALLEVEFNAERIRGLTGKKPRYYRPGTGWYEEEAKELIEEKGYKIIEFDIVSGDYTGKSSAGFIMSKILKAGNGSIVLMHLNHPDWNTKEGLELAVPELRRRGYRFVKIEEGTGKSVPNV